MNFDNQSRLVYQVRGGSLLYGTWNEHSDEDLRGIIIPPLSYFMGLDKFEQYQSNEGDEDFCYYDIRKFFKLALDGNPNVLELLWSNEAQKEHGNRIREMRRFFLSKAIVRPHIGMSTAHYKRLERGPINWKDAMHVIRVLSQCIDLLTMKQIIFPRPDAEFLKEVRAGEWSWDYVSTHINDLMDHVRDAEHDSDLPKTPNRRLVGSMMGGLIIDYLRQNGEL